MWFPESNIKIWLYLKATDMRCSYNGLSALVKQKLNENPLGGQLFVFVNRKKTQMKVLYFDRTGYCIWAKRLEQGQFNVGCKTQGQVGEKISLNWTQLKMIIEGIDTSKLKQFKRCKTP